MPHDQAYLEAEKKIESARNSQTTSLNLSAIGITKLPETIGQLPRLQSLYLANNNLTELPETIGGLQQLHSLYLTNNKLSKLPESIGGLTELQQVYLSGNQLTALPESCKNLLKLQTLNLSNNRLLLLQEWIGKLCQLRALYLNGNQLVNFPESLGKLEELWILDYANNQITDLPHSLLNLNNFDRLVYFSGSNNNNPFNPELRTAYREGLDAVKAYLRAKAAAQITLNEAKLILIGEGEVGKTCLLTALRDEPFVEGLPTTHGIQIKPIKLTNPDTQTALTLNGWDFGGQRVYRPTHQLFFSAPAVYLVVWKPREGPQQGFVKEWIKLVKHREPSAKIIVVATHGGPQQRQPDIDRQELWDLFGKDTVVDFFFVDSKPDARGQRKGIEELKRAIARVAAELPEVGRSVPKSFADVRAALQARSVPYLPLDEVLAICRAHHMDDEIARLFLTISHRLGHFTHYQHDPALRDIVILKPDWLATAISYVLDDEETRTKNHGLVSFSRLGQLWNDPSRPEETRYSEKLHKIFLRLMERFDLSYRVAGVSRDEENNPVSLIAQLVPDNRPDPITGWVDYPPDGNSEKVQICRIVDEKGNSASAEGLFYQLIVRLHKHSLGRVHYDDSVHWQRGLVLDDGYNGRALLEHIGNDVRITVRAPYPEFFLSTLTREVKYLVESFWEGLHCDVMVPCISPCGKNEPGTGLFEVEKLMDSKRRTRPDYPCPVCNEWQNIDSLLRNAPAATKPISLDDLQKEFATIKDKLDEVNTNTKSVLSRVDKTYTDLLQVLTDEAKEGPRLFSLFPLDRSKFNPKEWIREKFRLVLWCEHSRLPLPVLNNGDMKKGVYDLDLDREWFKKASPYLKFLSGTLSMVLPVASSAVKLALDKPAYDAIEEQLAFGKSIIDATLGETTKLGEFMSAADSTTLEHGVALRSDGATLRELHALLKAKDPGFGGLVRVMNKRQEFLWVHPQFEKEY